VQDMLAESRAVNAKFVAQLQPEDAAKFIELAKVMLANTDTLVDNP